MIMAFKEGQEVRAKSRIDGGILKGVVEKGQPGVITKARWSGKFDVRFYKERMGQVNVKLTDVSESDLEKK
jgi:hypothetical protein